MAFWSAETIKQRAGKEDLVRPFDAERVEHGAYELSLGEEIFLTSSDDQQVDHVGKGEHRSIPPGQFAMLLTEETVRIPHDAIGLISIKARIKFRGLVNVSGFHVDPGYCGKLKFSVYNAGSQPVVLTRGKPLFLLWFVSLDQPTGEPYRNHEDNDHITAIDVMNMQGEIASPNELKRQVDKLRTELRLWQVGIGILIALISGALIPFRLQSCGPSLPRASTAEPAIQSSSASARTLALPPEPAPRIHKSVPPK